MNDTEQDTTELNGTEKQPQLQMGINMQMLPDGNVLVTASIGVLNTSIVIPSGLYDTFNSKTYLTAKRAKIQLLDSIRRSRND